MCRNFVVSAGFSFSCCSSPTQRMIFCFCRRSSFRFASVFSQKTPFLFKNESSALSITLRYFSDLEKVYKRKNYRFWTQVEEDKLLEAVQLYPGDWKKVSEHLNFTQSPVECEVKYKRYETAITNTSPWGPKEDEILLNAVSQSKDPVTQKIDWAKVTTLVGDRTEGQCYRRYTRQLTQPKLQPRHWSQEEDELLMRAVEYCNEHLGSNKSTIAWAEVAKRMNGRRNAKQCSARWGRVFATKRTSSLTFTRWQPDEHEALLDAVSKSRLLPGNRIDWKNVSILMNHVKDPYQCRVRYDRHLKDNIFPTEMNIIWPPAKNEILKNAIEKVRKENNGKIVWQLVSEIVGDRTSRQCADRWDKIKRRGDTSLPRIRKTPATWTVAEDEKLKVAHGQCYDAVAKKTNWIQIAKLVGGGKEPSQCVHRWRSLQTIERSRWLPDEDQLLKSSVFSCSSNGRTNWNQVPVLMKSNRFPGQCRARWRKLLTKDYFYWGGPEYFSNVVGVPGIKS